MNNIDDFFQFRVGDWVVLRQSKSQPLLVVERVLQQCHGGVQVHYRFRAYTSAGTVATDLVTCTEPELEPIQKPLHLAVFLDLLTDAKESLLAEFGKEDCESAAVVRDAADRVKAEMLKHKKKKDKQS